MVSEVILCGLVLLVLLEKVGWFTVKTEGVSPTIFYSLAFGMFVCPVGAFIINGIAWFYLFFFLTISYLTLYAFGGVKENEDKKLYGDSLGFISLIVAVILLSTLLARIYGKMLPWITSSWGSPENWDNIKFLLEYRSPDFWLCRFGIWLTSSIYFPLTILFTLLMLWFIQKELKKEYARIMLIFCYAFAATVTFLLLMSASGMCMLPLSRHT